MTKRPRRPNAAKRPSAPRPSAPRRDDDLQAEVERLRRELAETQLQLDEIAKKGADAYTKRRMEQLDEARLTARGQALEAAKARNKAEAELRALTDAIDKAPGVTGWLLRRARRNLQRPR